VIDIHRKLKWTKKYSQQDWIYRTNSDNSARFVLGIKGKYPLVCFGVNPSTACPEYPDQTLIRVEKYAYTHRFDSWIMLNVYPQREPDPKKIDPTVNDALHEENMAMIKNIISRRGLNIWAAWGDVISNHKHLQYCLSDIHKAVFEYDCKWVALGTSQRNNPLHPLYRGKGFKLYTTPLTDLILL